MSESGSKIQACHLQLHKWYLNNSRELPWRTQKDPYKIWISEVMLQQTTSEAVKPFFRRFIHRLPTLDKLARAKESTVLELWSGLGYYSRARNLHKAAKSLANLKTFPRSYKQLLELPGFGPYTSRAVSSIAFDEPVGVLDGNVIRILSRLFALKTQWWKVTGRTQLQQLADDMVQGSSSADLNQAMMDLGATVCLPQNPQCILCPWLKNCEAHKLNLTDQLPFKKPKKQREIWIWYPQLLRKSGRIALIKNDYAPFLKNQWFLPGKVRKAKTKPKAFDYKHTITHHDIFVKIQRSNVNFEAELTDKTNKWVWEKQLSQWIPASLVHKAVQHCNN